MDSLASAPAAPQVEQVASTRQSKALATVTGAMLGSIVGSGVAFFVGFLVSVPSFATTPFLLLGGAAGYKMASNYQTLSLKREAMQRQYDNRKQLTERPTTRVKIVQSAMHFAHKVASKFISKKGGDKPIERQEKMSSKERFYLKESTPLALALAKTLFDAYDFVRCSNYTSFNNFVADEIEELSDNESKNA